ncbi:MAG: putative Ig domain-containing protein [Christensenellales bacterium]|jgi:hypothetical protein
MKRLFWRKTLAALLAAGLLLAAGGGLSAARAEGAPPSQGERVGEGAEAEPSASVEPSASAGPAVSVEPSATAEPTASVEPSATAEPSASAEPSPSVEPSASVESTASAEPSASAEPAAASAADSLPGQTTILVEGAAVSRTGIQPAIDAALADYGADRPAGDVTLVLNPADKTVRISNMAAKAPYTYINVPTDKGITSFTITTTLEGATMDSPVFLLSEMGSEASNIFANGIPLAVSGPISVGGFLYGGSDGADTGGTHVAYGGATGVDNRTVIYGGGYNGSVHGSTQVTVTSSHAAYSKYTIFSVYGGGYAEGDGAAQGSPAANVSGDTRVDLYAPVVNVYGGGEAYYGATANVGGDAHVRFHPGSDLKRKAYGGGYAYNSYSYAGATSTANVAGVCHLQIDAALTQTQYDGDFVVGGGYAAISASSTSSLAASSALASVGGVSIQINGNITTNSEPNTDWCVVGGGDTDGRSHANPDAAEGMDLCRADVNGSVDIRVGAGVALSRAIVGGGAPTSGGSAEVSGQVRIQVGDGAALGGITGGGLNNCGIYRAVGADVGGVSITLGDGVNIQGDLVGGGRNEYDFGRGTPQGTHADVLGDVKITIGQDLTCTGWFYGGGLANARGTQTQVTGGVTTAIGANAKISGQFVGGGGSQRTDAVARVGGPIRNSVGGGFSCTAFTGAGRAQGGTGSLAATGAAASTYGLEQTAPTVSSTFAGGSVGTSDYVFGAGRAYNTGSDATVYGDTALRLERAAPSQNVYAGGLGSQGVANVVGSATLIVQDASIDKKLYDGGYEASGGQAQVQSAQARLLGEVSLTGGVWTEKAATDGLTVYVGDGSTPTDASVALIYDDRTNLVVTDKATLRHWANNNALLWNAQDIQLDPGGCLQLGEHDESIAGDFIGGGCLQLEAGHQLSIGGAVSGTTEVAIHGQPALGEVYIQANAGHGDGVFYMQDGLKLAQEDGKPVWKIMGMTPPAITTAALPGGQAGRPYSQTLAADGDGQMTWTLLAGQLPPGLSLEADAGVISGVPTAEGTYAFTVSASNGADPDSRAELSIAIAPAAWAVRVEVYKDGAPWPDHGMALSLAPETGAPLTDLDAAPEGTYRLLADGADTGVRLNVTGPTETALNCYTVSFAAQDAGAARGSEVMAQCSGRRIESGQALPAGSALTLTARGRGAQSYAYRWSDGLSGAERTLPPLAGPVSLSCTVTGEGAGSAAPSATAAPSAPPSIDPVASAAPSPTAQPAGPATGDADLPALALILALLSGCGLLRLCRARRRA